MLYNNHYVSDKLYHFVGRHKQTQEEQFQLLVDILERGYLRSTRKGNDNSSLDIHERIVSGELTRIPAICFCDIPQQSLQIHMNKYSQFGISFKKQYLTANGAKPVIYIPIKSSYMGRSNRGEVIPKHLRKLLDALIKINQSKEKINQLFPANSSLKNKINAAANEWNFLANEFYYFIKMFDEDLEKEHAKNYYMEREWRLVNSPNQTKFNFDLDDIQSIIVPNRYRYALQQEFNLQSRIIGL